METTKYGYEEFLNILDMFKLGQDALAQMELQIVGGENDLDPEDLLRLYEAERSLFNSKDLAQKLTVGKEIILSSKGTGRELLHFKYVGGDITLFFKPAPYLLQQFYSMCYGLLLKKLTPPSSDFEISAQSLEVSGAPANVGLL
jgi:hypothetical protein